jgi:hypothetical protein
VIEMAFIPFPGEKTAGSYRNRETNPLKVVPVCRT